MPDIMLGAVVMIYFIQKLELNRRLKMYMQMVMKWTNTLK